MCRVSKKLKLCTCNTALSKLKHYWVLHRFSRVKDVAILGEAILPRSLSVEDEWFNRETLLRLLNEGNVFDVDLKPANKDRLLLTFSVAGDVFAGNPRINYGFVYNNGHWHPIEFDVFEWMHHHDEAEFGKIKDALK